MVEFLHLNSKEKNKFKKQIKKQFVIQLGNYNYNE